jgi:hypothetical protein
MADGYSSDRKKKIFCHDGDGRVSPEIPIQKVFPLFPSGVLKKAW